MLNRRTFLKRSALLTALASAPVFPPFATRVGAQSTRPGNPLRLPADWTGGTLSVAPTSLPVWPGFSTDVFAVNGSVPGPTIRVQRGQEFVSQIDNQLAEPLVLHWHGILAPERMDGHPRDAVGAGQSYDLRFPVNQRASTSWYHAHTDLLTAEQVYAGVAGLFIVEDPEEQALDLPRSDHDVPLVIADRRSNAQRQFTYAPTMMDIMAGYLGDVALVNGTPEAWLSVDQNLYRFRLLNGSNARVFKIAFSDDHPFHLIGSDGGLLPAPIQVTSAMLAPGERLEILMDFSGYSLGDSGVLKSLSFPCTGGMMGGPPQGIEMNLMQFYVDDPTGVRQTPPATLIPFVPHDPDQVQRTRIFTLAAGPMARHTINGQLFEMERIDFAVPFGDLEIWEYRNNSMQPHPMHMHATHFQVLERVGQPDIRPEDRGWKDTVLVDPGETVRVLLRFDAHPGLFVHHCHNLEHEDIGMMQNFEVLPPPTLEIQRGPDATTVSWPSTFHGWTLEASPSLAPGADWHAVTQPPVNANGKWTVTIPETGDHYFYRLTR
jgi:FtsP/CotA-like multicopper oxidase with cupredoxin domain